MNTQDYMLWVEKYRPKTIEECILPDSIKTAAQGFIDSKEMPNLLLTGPAGTGKTTLAKALCEQLGYDWYMINGSNEGRLIDTLRTKITQFATSVSFHNTRKVVILDEADSMPADTVQPALRNFIEEYHSNCGFILTCNFPNRIIEPLHSRTTVIDFTIPADQKAKLAMVMLKRVMMILDENDVQYEKSVVAEVVKQYFPDFRRTLNELQRLSSSGVIDTGALTAYSDPAQINKLVSLLKDKNFREVRKWVGNTPSLDMTHICRVLYDKMYDYVEKDSIPQLVLTLADYQYKNAFVSDKEINLMAMFTELMMEVEFNEPK